MIDPEETRAELERVCESRTFCRSARLIDFLRFTVTETLAGRQADLKEYAIGTEVYGRGTDFDPKADSIVRSEAARLRMKLDEYYANEGKNNPTRIKYVKGGYAPLFEDGTLRSGATAVKPSTLAVLPFVNTSGLAENECFSDGLTDELISALTAVPNLRVIARTTVFQFKGKTLDIREIGRRINADVVVEGTVRTAGERIRITAQLIDVGTGAHVWSQTYERNWGEVFAIQTDITRSVSDSLRRTLLPEPPRHEPDAEAHRLYLRGRYCFHRWTVEEVKQSVCWFQRALERDPQYTGGWAGLGDAHSILAYWGTDAEVNSQAAEHALGRALSIDPNFAEAQSIYAGHLASFRWKWAESERAFMDVIQRGHTPAYALYSMLCLTPQGRFTEAADWMRRALDLDPLFLGGQAHLGRILHLDGCYEEAVAQLENTLEIDSTFREAHWQLALAHESAGEYDTAMASFGRALALSGDSPGAWGSIGHCCAMRGEINEARRYQRLLEQLPDPALAAPSLVLVHAALGETGQAMKYLEACFAAHSPILLRLKTDPRFAPLRSERSCQAILAGMGFA